MKKYSFNFEKSKKIYDDNSCNIEVKNCYKNILYIAVEHKKKIKSKQWRITYGYVLSVDNILVRHCFLLDEDDTVLDPTFFSVNRRDIKNRFFYVSYIFVNIEEYLRALQKDGNNAGLYNYLEEYDKKVQEWASEHDLIVIS